MKAVILGSTGYVGQVLLRLLVSHPQVHTIIPVSSSSVGESVFSIDAGLDSSAEAKLALTDGKYVDVAHAAAIEADVVFCALPHLKSAELAEPFFGKSVVIDLSADFRIKDEDMFQQAYGQAPPRPDLLQQAVYGLSEWNEDEIRSANLIANPGCYPTASLLPLLPVMKAGLVTGPVIINAMSGISGAGKKAKEHLLYTSRTENAAAYAPGRSHRHWQEICNQSSIIGSYGDDLYFTPHLVPIHHGMQVTTSLSLKEGTSDEQLNSIFLEAYTDRPFVRIRSDIPETSQVRSTNRCDFTWHREGNQLFLISVIDNLYKGASGQAVQNMNIRFGFDQTSGLKLHGEI